MPGPLAGLRVLDARILAGPWRLLVPKPFVSVEPTGPSVYRTVDREHPTLIIDEADDLFYRKTDLRAIVNAG